MVDKIEIFYFADDKKSMRKLDQSFYVKLKNNYDFPTEKNDTDKINGN